MTDTVKWGILGNANIARVCVIPAIQKSRNGIVRALGSRIPEQARSVAAKHRIPRVYDSYAAVLEDPAVNAVYIPLPNHLHHPWTIKALQAGKHVLCEKPLACTAAQARDMAATAGAQGLLLMEAFMYRFHPRSREIKSMVADGVIGSPRLVRAAFCYAMEAEKLTGAAGARLLPEQGGGALLDVGCYCVSVARWLMAEEPLRVQAQAVYHHSGSDLHMAGILGFPGNGFATLEASFIAALQQTYTIVGSAGAIELPHNAFIPWERDAAYRIRRRDEEEGRVVSVPGADQYRLMVEHFADAVLGRTEPAFTLRDSIDNMLVLDALAKAAKSGTTITVEG